MEPYLFKFEFSSVHNKIKNMNYHVIAKNEEDMKMFLLQHNFTDSPIDAITVLPSDKYDPSEYRYTLEKYLFKSNKSDELFTVMTCQEFVDHAVETTCNSLTDSLLFGEAILRRDIGVFKLIGDLVHSLPHTNIMDFVLADVDSTDDTVHNSINEILEMRKTYHDRIGSRYDDGSYYIHQSMEFDRCDTLPQPITIESYIAAFTERMVDVFE